MTTIEREIVDAIIENVSWDWWQSIDRKGAAIVVTAWDDAPDAGEGERLSTKTITTTQLLQAARKVAEEKWSTYGIPANMSHPETWDADTADCALQFAFYGEIVWS